MRRPTLLEIEPNQRMPRTDPGRAAVAADEQPPSAEREDPRTQHVRGQLDAVGARGVGEARVRVRRRPRVWTRFAEDQGTLAVMAR